MLLTVIIDSAPDRGSHVATVTALEDAIAHAGVDGGVRVVRTPEIDADFLADPGHGMLIGPGSPYDDPTAVEAAIRVARERGVPLVGT